jgi:hypothetical protein
VEDDRIEGAERRTIDAEQRALVAERQMSALQEQFQVCPLENPVTQSARSFFHRKCNSIIMALSKISEGR